MSTIIVLLKCSTNYACKSKAMYLNLNNKFDYSQTKTKIRLHTSLRKELFTHSSCKDLRIAGILVADGGRGFTKAEPVWKAKAWWRKTGKKNYWFPSVYMHLLFNCYRKLL